MTTFLNWLDTHSGLVSAVSTAVLVAVTIVYALLTGRMAKATEGQLPLLKQELDVLERQVGLQTSLTLLDRMERSRPDRTAVRQFIKAARSWRDLSSEELAHVEAASRSFDILGYFYNHELVDRGFVHHFYASTLLQLYDEFLHEYVVHVRSASERGPTMYWELVQLVKHLEPMRGQHPAELGLDAWPPGSAGAERGIARVRTDSA